MAKERVLGVLARVTIGDALGVTAGSRATSGTVVRPAPVPS